MTNHVLKKIAKSQASNKTEKDTWAARAQAIYDGANEVQKRLIDDTSQWRSTRCPRRSGKSFGFTSLALWFGEKFPGSRILIVSLTLKSTKENYWTGAPGGLFAQNYRYGLNLNFNHTDNVWFHENGSRGRLAGAETRADIEYFRGAAAEADIIIVDECKSFAPALLTELITNVIKPGLLTRKGSLIMGGTPGNIPEGPFYEATEPKNAVKVKLKNGEVIDRPTCVPYAGKPLPKSDGRWSLHTWTMQENTAKPWQWDEALNILANDYRGNEDHPVWRREYLGEWVTNSDELVYAFSKQKHTGTVTWFPEPTKDNPTGLPDGRWNLIMGLDFGYEDDCAIVVSAWNENLQELREVYCWRQNHLTIDGFAQEIHRVITRFGTPQVIVGDAGALGKMIVADINQRHGLGIIPAEKKEKYDYIELLNSDFCCGRIKIVSGSPLDHELSALQWDLEKDKTLLIRTGKLREDPSCANHLCDAFLYSWRYSYHFWAKPLRNQTPQGTPEWFKEQEKEMLNAYKKRLQNDSKDDYLKREFRRIKADEYRGY